MVSLLYLQLRNVIDPKRHYKKGDSKLTTFPKYFQVEYYFVSFLNQYRQFNLLLQKWENNKIGGDSCGAHIRIFHLSTYKEGKESDISR